MEAPWLTLYVAARLVACAMAFLLLAWTGIEPHDLVLLLYGPLSTAALAASPKLRRSPVAWAIDIAATLALVLESADWRSPYYMLWLAALALPAAYLPLRHAAWLAVGAPIAFLLVAIWGGPGARAPGGDLDGDARDPRRAAGDARRRPGLRARHAAPALRRALRA